MLVLLQYIFLYKMKIFIIYFIINATLLPYILQFDACVFNSSLFYDTELNHQHNYMYRTWEITSFLFMKMHSFHADFA